MKSGKQVSRLLAKLMLPSLIVSSVGYAQVFAMGNNIAGSLKAALTGLSHDDQLHLLNILYEGIQIFLFEQPDNDVYYNACQYGFYEALEHTIVSEYYETPLYIPPFYKPKLTVKKQKFNQLKSIAKSFLDIFINDRSKYVLYLPNMIKFCEERIKNGRGAEVVDDYHIPQQ